MLEAKSVIRASGGALFPRSLGEGLRILFFAALCFSLLAILPASGEAQAPKKELRIISLYAAHTEVVIRLGAKDKLVGVSLQETYKGPETEGWEWPMKFSVQDDVEKYLAARPDIVLIRPQHLGSAAHLFDTLRNSGIQVWVKQIIDAPDLYAYWEELGRICGEEEAAKKLVADFKEKIAPFEANINKPDKPGVFLESIHREIKTFTPGSIPEWLLSLAGGENVATDAEPARKGLMVANYGPEKLLEKADKIDVYISQDGAMNTTPLNVILERDIFQIIPAFKNGRVFKIPEYLISRPTPSLYEGLLLMRDMIYPPEEGKKTEPPAEGEAGKDQAK